MAQGDVEIDQKVYALYQLKEDEIKMIGANESGQRRNEYY
jgi:hypothetical protein